MRSQRSGEEFGCRCDVAFRRNEHVDHLAFVVYGPVHQDALEIGSFPTASFSITEPIDFASDASSGKAVSVVAKGKLTVHGVTKELEFPLEAQLVNNTIVIVGSTNITFSDYGVAVPASRIVVSVEDSGILELQLLLVR